MFRSYAILAMTHSLHIMPVPMAPSATRHPTKDGLHIRVVNMGPPTVHGTTQVPTLGMHCTTSVVLTYFGSSALRVITAALA